MRQMHLCGFLIAGPVSHSHAIWRNPAHDVDFLDLDFYLGIGATRSTTYDQPYHVAREFATLDHLSGGRAAWNVVTSMNDSEARNFGIDAHLDHDRRYDRADEFVELTFKLWRSWDDDALILDKARGIYADPSRVHYVNHEGRWFR